ncbi:helix-turn-helix domain-containing protein [Phenylobacterium sp.]|uniref:helix-turn-helix domain-containing protein n=1 Tax=Phenylobacterium sp. TaxID=1871053 RepID=UPI0025F72AC9|nr:helix-turn-helix domain-containing protein [Phenylobacterium sp.]
MLRKRLSRKQADRAALRERALGVASADAPPPGPPPPVDPLLAFESLGEALKAIRETRKLTVQQVADQTRVRRAYLEAIEATQLDLLPSRPFTVGYIRAYATALGVDPDVAVERFKTDEPVLEETLRAPVGMPEERDPRVAAFLIGALVIVAAIVLWNVAQRAMMANVPPPPLAPEAFANQALRNMKPGVMRLGSPLPAPVESTTPPPYETPGLAEAMGLKADPAAASKPKPANEAPKVDLASLPPLFQIKGKVYDAGNPRIASTVTVQALKNASLIVRGADGSVYFARQLTAGEAYRVPSLAGLTLDVSVPQDFQVFVGGASRGILPAQQVLASKLAAGPTAP